MMLEFFKIFCITFLILFLIEIYVPRMVGIISFVWHTNKYNVLNDMAKNSKHTDINRF